MSRLSSTLWAAVLLLGLTFQSSGAHEGHSHRANGEGEAAAVALPGAPRAEAASRELELVAIARNGELTLYLDRAASNEPVSGASVSAETPQGSVGAKAAGEGIYKLPAPWSASPGSHNLIVTVTKDGVADILTLALDIPPPDAAGESGRATKGGVASRLGTSGLPVAVAVLLAFVAGGFAGTILARRRRAVLIILAGCFAMLLAQVTLAHEGDSHSSPAPGPAGAQVATSSTGAPEIAQMLPDGSVFVPKSMQRILDIRTAVSEPATYRRTVELPGRIIPDPNASGFVQAAIGGRLAPPEGGFPRLGTPVRKGDVLAYVTSPLQAIDVSDMRQRQGELDQQLAIVERRVARFEALVPGGAVPRTQLDDAKLELQGLRDRRASLDKVRQEPEPLLAPVDGIIADGSPVAGQIAQTNAVIFQIIDPARLWVEALSYESLPNVPGAMVRIGDRQFSLAFRGAGFADRNQSIPIHFAINGDVGGLRVGQFVTVLAETPDQQRGLAVPRTSLVRNSAGQDLIYEHVAAERFRQRVVRVEPLDGQRVLISQGLDPGRRVVVQGAELIDHIR